MDKWVLVEGMMMVLLWSSRRNGRCGDGSLWLGLFVLVRQMLLCHVNPLEPLGLVVCDRSRFNFAFPESGLAEYDLQLCRVD